MLDDTLVIVASDHGEHLGDHLLFFHGCSLYRQLVGVPLVIVGPEGAGGPGGRRAGEPARLPATVVDLLGLADDSPFPGRSLARFWSADGPPKAVADEPLLMEAEPADRPDEPGARAGRQGADEGAGRRGDALHPHGRRPRGALRTQPTRKNGSIWHVRQEACRREGIP